MKSLYGKLTVPSIVHTYSVITEYVYRWFMDTFDDKDFFKTIHLEGRNVFDEFRNFDFIKGLKIEKPALLITPKIDLEFNNDMLGANEMGSNYYLRYGNVERAFFKDYDDNLYLGCDFMNVHFDYAFKVRVETKAQQLDLYHMISMAFRVGGVFEDEESTVDYHIPYSIMIAIAKAKGYEIINNTIVDVVSFLKYFNAHSIVPVVFKLRTINQHMEFFMRAPNTYIKIEIPNRLTYDDGEKIGMVSNNFHLDFEANLETYTPKFYLFYSPAEEDIPTYDSSGTTEGVYNESYFETKLTPIPETYGGIKQYYITEYLHDSLEDTTVDLSEMFLSYDLIKPIEYLVSSGLDPADYIKFYIVNGSTTEISYTIDWEEYDDNSNHVFNMVLDKEELNTRLSIIGIFINTQTINELKETFNNLKGTRIDYNGNP